MTTSVHYTVLIECNLSCIHSVSSLLTFDLCMCTWRTLFHWWRRHSVWCCPQTSCYCGQGVFPCPYVASCPPLCMSMAVVFGLHSLRDHCLAPVRISSPYNAQGIGVRRNLGCTRHPMKLSSPAIHCSSLTSCCDTHTVGTAVPFHVAGGRERVWCRTVNTVR